MGRFAERRQERREARQESRNGGGSEEEDEGPASYVMRKKLLAFGNAFEIKKASRRHGGRVGRSAFYVDNKVVRTREIFSLRESPHGNVVLYQEVQESKLCVRDSMAIDDVNGDKVAEIKENCRWRRLQQLGREVRGDRDWQVHGSTLEHNFTIKEGGKSIVTFHQNWVDQGCILHRH